MESNWGTNSVEKKKDSVFINDPYADIRKPTSLNSLEEEFNSWLLYCIESTEPDVEDYLLFWKAKQSKWPTLAKLACELASIPASSTPSERAFSGMGRIITKLRNRIAPETAGMLLFMKSNTNLW